MATAAVDAPKIFVAAWSGPASHSFLRPARSTEYHSSFVFKENVPSVLVINWNKVDISVCSYISYCHSCNKIYFTLNSKTDAKHYIYTITAVFKDVTATIMQDTAESPETSVNI
jgi:hypothetical protein